MTERLKVQIYKDALSSSIDTSIAHEGLKLASPDDSIFTVVDDSMHFTLKNTEHEVITEQTIIADKTYLPLEKGIFSLVLTDRNITWSDSPTELSYGFAHNISPSTGFAVVNVNSPSPESTAAHETGHLLGMRYFDSNDHDTIHCPAENCLMHGKALIDTENYPQRAGEKLLGERFCFPCTEQLAVRAFVLMSYIEGKPVPRTWFDANLFPSSATNAVIEQ